MNETMMENLSILLQIIKSRDWLTLQHLTLDNPKVFRTISQEISDCSQLNGMTLLHAAIRFDPPLHIVAEIIEICPHLLSAQDCLGRTPLHIASGSRARESLIKLLVDAYPKACAIRDNDGMTPLHMACNSSCKLFEGDNGNVRGPPSYEVVRALLLPSEDSVTFEDVNEMSPIEYAILSNAPLRVVRLLQRSASRSLTANSKS
ncbi:hypothetical protein HJC23_002283 [Cyclotella cryptica]|uniref:Uncharacterized protein n=1 Tax=Cyclotella cryptica TaxID=29204 RepID=A0ABD3QN57_9STRA|eukprot:CCRYP_005771-RA/>CCRYP_005771-RA protein AED:0.21 eAED:0.21 QI:0/-1/0/1/-1/1/1/0/203